MTNAIFYRYAERIYSGHKCVELRRTAPKRVIERAWIYETAPVKRVTGWFEPGLIYPAMDCEALLERFGEEKCLGMQVAGTKEEQLRAMIEALGDRPLHAISIKSAYRISPVELRFRPPQSWMYCRKTEKLG
jgi:predicted transcriptional regulator